MNNKVLFACSKCFSRHQFEELSEGQQLCKDCRGTFPLVKCTYCRSEFQQASKGSTSPICRKCEQNVKQYGKPSACECCNIIAAFIGSKCQRCATSELKYGPPVQCEQCKQRCAFDKHDENKKIDGKLLCWLCTLSYKRAVLKARHVDKGHLSKKRSAERSIKEKAKKHIRSSDRDISTSQSKQSANDLTDKSSSSRQGNTNNIGGNACVVTSSTGGVGGGGGGGGGGSSSSSAGGGGIGTVAAAAPTIDPHSSDHVVAMTQLKEQIASLQKRLVGKDKELLEKDKLITELKGRNFSNENELRNKMKESERLYEMKIELLSKKVTTLLKEVASLKKGVKRNEKFDKNIEKIGNGGTNKESAKDSGGSGTDSPVQI